MKVRDRTKPRITDRGVSIGTGRQEGAVTLYFSDDYKETLFLSWYRGGKPTIKKFYTVMPKDENNNIPTMRTVEAWSHTYAWDERADILDSQATRQVEVMAIQEKVEMFQRQAKAGRALMEKGMDFFETEVIEKASDAINAIVKGAELEKASVGVPQALLKISDMNDSQLKSLIETIIGGRDVAGLLGDFDIDDETVVIDSEEVTNE